jgi:oxygen-independent coproporphyrinogen-3 oxidase
MTASELLAKYDVPVPRYTSYPTVPTWRTTPSPEAWRASLASAVDREDAALSVYVHLPFCESLCSFCGCNNVITRDHGREQPYIDLVLAELDRYLDGTPALADAPVRQIHLGGGTPTFLAPPALDRLVRALTARLPRRDRDFEGAIEVDPRVTTQAHLETIRALGFDRLSLGVQDIDAEVQRLVNRVQPLDVTRTLCRSARALGFASVNLDLIYGLPGQTPDSMARLADAILALEPDRLAVYSFARVPWIKPAQRRFRDDQIPVGADKRALYEIVRAQLVEAGYVEIGLDHFARPSDALARAAETGTLHRNFMGYADVATSVLLGLGVSAISETPACYHQNEKVLPVYEKRVRAGEVPTLRGHVLTPGDRRRREVIASLMTRYRAVLTDAELRAAQPRLGALREDGIVDLDGHTLSVPLAGRPFLRHAAALFDEHLAASESGPPTYSTAV